MIVPLDEPEPVLHVYGFNPCGGLAMVVLVRGDYGDRFTVEHFEHVDGRKIVRGTLTERCDSCGRIIDADNLFFAATGRARVLYGPDPFKLAMRIAIAREELRSKRNPSPVEAKATASRDAHQPVVEKTARWRTRPRRSPAKPTPSPTP